MLTGAGPYPPQCRRAHRRAARLAAATALAACTAPSFGSTVIGKIDGRLPPSNGLAKSSYTWSLWPRLSGVSGGASVSDFAPDNSNLAVTNLSPAPEPTTTLMLAAGLAVLAFGARRRRAD